MSQQSRLLIVVAVFLVVAALAVIFGVRRHTGPPGALRAAFDAEFLTRPDGYRGLREHYDLRFSSDPMQMDPGLMYKAISDGAVDVIDGFATDGRIPVYGLMVLKDDKGFFPPYYAAPVVRAETLKKYPELEDILNRLAGKFSDQAMQKLNYEVDEKGRKACNVAREFLELQELIPSDAKPGDGSEGTITIGSKHFTEQEILGEIMAILIECHSNIEVVRKLNLGGTMISFNALKAGDLDLYAEYTGTGLVSILKQAVIPDPDKAYETVRRAFQNQYDLKWLQPFGFNNTYTLTMRHDHAEELGISTISDLAKYVRAQQEE